MFDFAVGAPLQAHQHFRKSGLAAAGFADDCDRLAFTGVEIQVFVGFDVLDPASGNNRFERIVDDLVILLHVVDLEHRIPEHHGFLAFTPRRLLGVVDLLPSQAAYMMVVCTAGDVLGVDLGGIASARLEVVAARAKVAPRRAIVGQGKLATDGLQGRRILVGGRQRDAPEKTVGIRMARPGKERIDGSFFDNLPRIHDEDPVAGLENQS